MPKVKDEVLDKKTKEEFKTQIMEEINTKYKQEIVDDIVLDVKKSFDNDYKGQIKDEVKEGLVQDLKNDIKKQEKKMVRKKNFKIFRLSIYVLVLLTFSLFLVYKLYVTDNLTIIHKNLTVPSIKVENKKTTTTKVTEPVKDFNYYNSNYGYLIEDIKISNFDLVKGNIDVKDISTNDRLAMAFSSLNDELIVKEGEITTVKENILSSAYNKLFGSSSGYDKVSFSVKGLNFVYSASTESYLSIGSIDDSISYVNNYIVDIFEDNGDIVFDTKVYVIKNNGIYNVNYLNYKIANYSEDLDISNFNNRLSGVQYRFSENNGIYILKSINKK